MPHPFHSLCPACPGAPRAAQCAARTQDEAGFGYRFYGYWFSHGRA